jgi:thymidylate synthase (FAD)
MNARELRHFFQVRCCNRAQWEIRDLAWEMRGMVKAIAPNLFEGSGPGCLYGTCPEGKMTCGKPYRPGRGRARRGASLKTGRAAPVTLPA